MWALPAGAGAGALAGVDTATRVRRRCLWSVLAVALGLLIAAVSAVEVITPKEIYVVYGTQGVLSCKFKSKITTGPATTVSWSFRPGESNTTVSFFHFVNRQVFPGDFPLFKNRVTWAGDLHKKDASIKIQDMQYNHNGTYICDVKNPPDIVSEPGYILLSVVEKEVPPTPWPRPQRKPWIKVSQAVGIGAAVILGLVLLFLLFKILLQCYIKKRSHPDNTGDQPYMHSETTPEDITVTR